MDVHKMAQRFHIRNKEFRLPVESLRNPNLQCPSPEGKTAVLRNNFSISDQTKMFLANHDSGSVESRWKGCCGSDKQISGSNIKKAEGKVNLEAMNSSINLLSSAAKATNTVPGSALVHTKQKKLQSSPETALSVVCDPHLNSFHRPTCHFCGLFGSLRCTKCKQIHYCSVDCQRKDWQMHSMVCRPVELNSDKVEDNAKSPDEVKKKEGVLFVNTNRTEEQNMAKKFSDLTTLGLKKNMKIQGTVTEFFNPSEFYIQVSSPEVLSNISRLTEILKDHGDINHNEYIPARGEVGIAEYSMDKKWYRVLIKEVDIHKKSAEVLYIDYGNGEIVSFNKIKRLDKDIAHFPPCAIKCCVANTLITKKEWNANIRSIVGPSLIGKTCSLTIINILMAEMPYFAVDVTLLNSGKHIHEIILEMEHEWNSKNVKNKEDYSSTGSILEKISIQKRIGNKDKSGCVTPKIISLTIGDEFLGMVAHIQTPGDFFCQQVENGCKLSALQVSLHEYCEKVSAIPDFCPSVGDMCCAQFTEDKQWYRASVLSYTSEKTVLVGYVDYGNVEVLLLSKLRPIIPELMELSVQAINCTLAGVKPASATWSTEATSVMKKLLQNKMVAIKVMDKKDNTFVVELTDESVTPVINVSRYLLETGFALEDSPTALTVIKPDTSVGEVNGENLDQVDWSWVKLKPQQVVDVLVCMLYNPSEFYCHSLTNNDSQALKDLNISLAEYCQKRAPRISKVTKGELCCAYFSGDGRWYRALVVEATTFEFCKVQFVDYGNCEEITLDKVRQISSAFMKLPFQAIKCCLSGIRPTNKEWTTEAVARLNMCTAGKKLQAKVVSVSADTTEIELTDISTSSPVIVNHILINEHLALKNEILTNQNMLAGELAATDFQEVSPGMQWTAAEFAVDETVSVRVLEVVNPGLFYVVPIQLKDEHKLRKLMIGLADYCNSLNEHIFKPKIGQACCARFSGDNNWYRAVVLGISVSEVKVVYADYGNVEVLPFSRLRPIISPYLELPFQILKCSLAGITELDRTQTKRAADDLKSLLLNECVIITVKGVNENVHSVTIQKNCETGIVDVADLLAVEGLTACSDRGNHCAKKPTCSCAELIKKVAKLEQLIDLLLKDRFGEDKISEIVNSLEG
ncbi:tudor domain-containing protein 1 isoform X2 [Pogona vitticeps]